MSPAKRQLRMKAQRALARRAAGARAGGWVGARARPVCTHVSESDPAITQASLPQSPTLLPLHTHPRSRRAGTPRVLWRHCSKTMMSCCEAWTGWPSRWAGRRCTPPPTPPHPPNPLAGSSSSSNRRPAPHPPPLYPPSGGPPRTPPPAPTYTRSATPTPPATRWALSSPCAPRQSRRTRWAGGTGARKGARPVCRGVWGGGGGAK